MAANILWKVARSTRAWIETLVLHCSFFRLSVARSTRAWIETVSVVGNVVRIESHALRVRGLKHGL